MTLYSNISTILPGILRTAQNWLHPVYLFLVSNIPVWYAILTAMGTYAYASGFTHLRLTRKYIKLWKNISNTQDDNAQVLQLCRELQAENSANSLIIEEQRQTITELQAQVDDLTQQRTVIKNKYHTLLTDYTAVLSRILHKLYAIHGSHSIDDYPTDSHSL
jgi:hypothetical protein